MATVADRFRFLVEDYGCKHAGLGSSSAGVLWARYKNATTGVEVQLDVPDQLLSAMLVKLRRGLFGARFPVYLETAAENWVDVTEFAWRHPEIPFPRDLAELDDLDPQEIRRRLELYADGLRTFGDATLRGDFTEFDGIIDEFLRDSECGAMLPYGPSRHPR